VTDLVFVEETHQYFLGGVELPSVTTVIDSVLTDWSKIPRDTLEYARQRGTAVHTACELWDLDDLDEDTLDPAIAPYLIAYRSFLVDSGFVPEVIEQRLVHRAFGFAGTLDRIGTLNGRRALIDLKSTEATVPSVGPQTAAYKAMAETPGGKIDGRYALLLRKNGTYRLIPCKDQSDWSIFMSALNIYKWRKNNGNS